MSLLTRLKEAPTPRDHDTILSNVWKAFAGSEAHEALQLLLAELQDSADQHLLSPESTARARAHAAGQTFAIRRILNTVGAALAFKPETAEYDTPPSPDSEIAPPDPFTVV